MTVRTTSRHSGSVEHAPNVTFSVVLTEDMRQRLFRRAISEDRSAAAVVRRVLLFYLGVPPADAPAPSDNGTATA